MNVSRRRWALFRGLIPGSFSGLLLAALLGLGIPGAPLRAQEGAHERPLVVVELFTSQGCASCPPADALLARLARRDDVLALSLHVDYWDYIGWPDTFARPEYTERQKAYAHAAGMRSIYTPQMIIAGKDHVIGSRPMEVADYIMMAREMPARVEMAAILRDGLLRIEARPSASRPLPGRLLVMLVRFRSTATVRIERGENAGKTIRYANVATSLSELGRWDGTGRLVMEVAMEEIGEGGEGDGKDGEDEEMAVFLQAAGPGEILGAVRVSVR